MRGQSSTELIIILAVFFLLLLSVLAVVSQRDDLFFALQPRLSARTVADQFATELNSVFLGGEGTTATVVLPAVLDDGSPYFLSVEPPARLVEIRWEHRGGVEHYGAPLIIARVDGTLTNLSGAVEITHTGSGVLLSEREP